MSRAKQLYVKESVSALKKLLVKRIIELERQLSCQALLIATLLGKISCLESELFA